MSQNHKHEMKPYKNVPVNTR